MPVLRVQSPGSSGVLISACPPALSSAFLAVGAYIDLDPVAAGIAEAPETSKYTSDQTEGGASRPKGKRLSWKPLAMAA